MSTSVGRATYVADPQRRHSRARPPRQLVREHRIQALDRPNLPDRIAEVEDSVAQDREGELRAQYKNDHRLANLLLHGSPVALNDRIQETATGAVISGGLSEQHLANNLRHAYWSYQRFALLGAEHRAPAARAQIYRALLGGLAGPADDHRTRDQDPLAGTAHVPAAAAERRRTVTGRSEPEPVVRLEHGGRSRRTGRAATEPGEGHASGARFEQLVFQPARRELSKVPRLPLRRAPPEHVDLPPSAKS